MKLFDLLHNIVEGMGQGQVAPSVIWSPEAAQPPSRPRAARINDFSRYRMFSDVTKVMVQAGETGRRADLCWLLADADDKILIVMQNAKAFDEGFFSWIRNSPGFDKTAIRRAMRSARKARYTVWQQGVTAENESKTR